MVMWQAKKKKENFNFDLENHDLESATFQIFYLQRLSATKCRSFFTGCQKSVINKQTNEQSEI